MRRPPLPTPSQAAHQWAPTNEGITKLYARIKPQTFPKALCAGKAPLFDSDPLNGETLEEFNERKQWAHHHCQACPESAACLTAARNEQQPQGLRLGSNPTYRRRGIA